MAGPGVGENINYSSSDAVYFAPYHQIDKQNHMFCSLVDYSIYFAFMAPWVLDAKISY
jgi:hypothetical protein